MPRRVPVPFAILFVSSLAVACGRNGDAAPGAGPGGPGGPGGGPPPMPVEAEILAEKPLEQTSEYIASLKSRRSTTIQPQVEGFLTRIAVRSGETVQRGAVLFEIDSASEQAGLAALESTRAVRDAELAYAAQELERTKALYAAGAVSQRELAQAETAQRTAQATLQAVDEQLRQQKTDLGYYRVTSPTAGIVGDIPVRQGDRVTKTTILTTVDENNVLEIYVNVPVQQAPDLKLGLPVRIVDDRGTVLATNKISFVSPTVEPTQTVLAKAALVEGRA
jgi:RND family efflux transporter MFP subunit